MAGGEDQDENAVLDYSEAPNANEKAGDGKDSKNGNHKQQQKRPDSGVSRLVGKLRGELPGLDENDEDIEDGGEKKDESEEEIFESGPRVATGGWLSAFRSLSGQKAVTRADLDPVLDGLQDVLMARNVAAEPAAKICESIAQKLDGKVIGTFSRVSSLVKEAMDETLVQV